MAGSFQDWGDDRTGFPLSGQGTKPYGTWALLAANVVTWLVVENVWRLGRPRGSAALRGHVRAANRCWRILAAVHGNVPAHRVDASPLQQPWPANLRPDGRADVWQRGVPCYLLCGRAFRQRSQLPSQPYRDSRRSQWRDFRSDGRSWGVLPGKAKRARRVSGVKAWLALP